MRIVAAAVVPGMSVRLRSLPATTSALVSSLVTFSGAPMMGAMETFGEPPKMPDAPLRRPPMLEPPPPPQPARQATANAASDDPSNTPKMAAYVS